MRRNCHLGCAVDPEVSAEYTEGIGAVDVMLSHGGHALAEKLAEDLESCLDPLISGLDPDEQNALHILLTKALGGAHPSGRTAE